MDGPTRICFVCTGNICRSPAAAAMTVSLARAAGIGERVEVESAGTGEWSVGRPADDAARAEARARGYDLDGHVGRRFTADDFDRFDLVLVMDWANHDALARLDPSAPQYAKIHYLREYDPTADGREVPDPYGGSRKRFAQSFDMIEAACRGLVTTLMMGDQEPAR